VDSLSSRTVQSDSSNVEASHQQRGIHLPHIEIQHTYAVDGATSLVSEVVAKASNIAAKVSTAEVKASSVVVAQASKVAVKASSVVDEAYSRASGILAKHAILKVGTKSVCHNFTSEISTCVNNLGKIAEELKPIPLGDSKPAELVKLMENAFLIKIYLGISLGLSILSLSLFTVLARSWPKRTHPVFGWLSLVSIVFIGASIEFLLGYSLEETLAIQAFAENLKSGKVTLGYVNIVCLISLISNSILQFALLLLGGLWLRLYYRRPRETITMDSFGTIRKVDNNSVTTFIPRKSITVEVIENR
jgi:hypothetical protein